MLTRKSIHGIMSHTFEKLEKYIMNLYCLYTEDDNYDRTNVVIGIWSKMPTKEVLLQKTNINITEEQAERLMNMETVDESFGCYWFDIEQEGWI